MKLRDLLKGENDILNKKDVKNFLNLEIGNIVNNSTEVKEGDLFIATKGFIVDAAKFIPDVIKKGVKVIICDNKSDIPSYNKSEVLIIKSKNQKALLGRILNKKYPNLPKHLIGITGTNGKTTVASLTRQLISQLNINVASIGSLGVAYVVNGKEKHIEYKHDLTNPDLIELYKYLDLLKREGVDYAVMETSSQGMRNGRLEGLTFDIGIFTNITRDHIGNSPALHPDEEDYFQWKMYLFRKLVKKNGYAIINADVPEYKRVKLIALRNNKKILSYGFRNSDIQIKEIKMHKLGQEAEIKIGKDILRLETKLIGDFQIGNIATAIGILIGLGFKKQISKLNFKKLKSPKGRADLMGKLPNGAKVYMDYPTTANALQNIIETFKKYQKAVNGGRVIILFGAGGDRDPAKRPEMGKVATDFADLAIITEDSPRTENPSNIRSDIIKGCNPNKVVNIGNEKDYETVEGRTRAVEYAISILQENDILVTNKGHEKHILINGVDAHYDEEELLKKLILRNKGEIE